MDSNVMWALRLPKCESTVLSSEYYQVAPLMRATQHHHYYRIVMYKTNFVSHLLVDKSEPI